MKELFRLAVILVVGFACSAPCRVLAAEEVAVAAGPAPIKDKQYLHNTDRGHVGEFVLRGRTGTADYWFDGAHHMKPLKWQRFCGVWDDRDTRVYKGHVYKVNGQDLWFLLGTTEIRVRGRRRYPMYWTNTRPGARGRQGHWRRIITADGTKVTDLAPPRDE